MATKRKRNTPPDPIETADDPIHERAPRPADFDHPEERTARAYAPPHDPGGYDWIGPDE